MVMIKDNHRVTCLGKQSLIEAVNKLRKLTRKKIELEVDTWEQFKEALQSKADFILLDNMAVAQIKRAVDERNKQKSHILLEASGGIALKKVKKYAATGVDRISVGALTHSPKALNMSLDFI
jgi:nicotinate-nucleotide pyrophosphorylase (carboxylating)